MYFVSQFEISLILKTKLLDLLFFNKLQNRKNVTSVKKYLAHLSC